jgi:hypothetical protein
MVQMVPSGRRLGSWRAIDALQGARRREEPSTSTKLRAWERQVLIPRELSGLAHLPLLEQTSLSKHSQQICEGESVRPWAGFVLAYPPIDHAKSRVHVLS